MEKRKKIVLLTVMFLAAISVLSIMVYPTLPPPFQTSFFFYLLVVSAWTSLAGCYWALYSVWKFYAELNRAKEEVYRRLGVPFVSRLVEVGQRLDARFAKLSPEQRERIINIISQTANAGFDRINELANMSKPKRKKVRKIREGG